MEFGLLGAIQLASRAGSRPGFQHRQVRAISTCRDSSNLVADWFTGSRAGLWPASKLL